MLAAIGMFVFETETALFDELARRRAWRHGSTERFGALPASQFLGPGEDEITISGRIVPGIAGVYSSLDRIAEMANTGDAFPLADGSGRVLGSFAILGLDQSHKELIDNGAPRMIDFSLTLRRVV